MEHVKEIWNQEGGDPSPQSFPRKRGKSKTERYSSDTLNPTLSGKCN
jgi:hypothetical protein